MATRPCNTFPPPSLKFRTVGFPQYGFKREVHGDLRRAVLARTYTPCQCDPRILIAIAGICSGSSVAAPPVQRPLARQRVVLSRQVSAYYGLIRDSGLLPLTYALYSGSLWPNYFPPGDQRFPNLLCVSVAHVPHSVPRWIVRLLLTVTSSHVLAFAIFVLARHPLAHKTGSLWRVNEAASFALCYGPWGLLALPRPGLLLSSFRLRWSPTENVEYNYMGNSQFP